MKKLKYFSTIILIVSVYCIMKAVSLFNVVKDGDGIGIYLLGLEINDTVPYEQIPKYSWSFLIIGVMLMAIFITVSITIYYKSKAYKVS